MTQKKIETFKDSSDKIRSRKESTSRIITHDSLFFNII
jgi:hypothetical protein